MLKILSVQSLALPEVKIIRFGRFADHRGYFGESFRRSEFNTLPELKFLHGVEFSQMNDSVSKPGTIRGMHFQFNPFMGKLVRTVYGRMIDTALDIRKDSPTFGKIVAYDLPASDDKDYNEWDLDSGWICARAVFPGTNTHRVSVLRRVQPEV